MLITHVFKKKIIHLTYLNGDLSYLVIINNYLFKSI